MDKFVYVKTAETMQGKSAKYLKITDQDGQPWNVFEQTPVPQPGKCYLFSFEKNGEWNNLTGIRPLVNVFQQKALKEAANRNDIIRNVSVATSYSVQLATSNKIPIEEIFLWADKIHDYIQLKTETLMPLDKEI